MRAKRVVTATGMYAFHASYGGLPFPGIVVLFRAAVTPSTHTSYSGFPLRAPCFRLGLQ